MPDADAFTRLMVREFPTVNFDEALVAGRPRRTAFGIAMTVLACALVWGGAALTVVWLMT